MSMVEVTIDSIRVSLTGHHRLVILKELDVERYLLIYVAPELADAIHYELQKIVVQRPLTHDLLKNVITDMGGKVSHIVVNDLRNNTYYAKIIIDLEGESLEVDSRPSDALALAVRTGAKLFVEDTVMHDAGVSPESGLDLEGDYQFDEEGAIPASEEDLEAFRDFVDTLDLDDLTK